MDINQDANFELIANGLAENGFAVIDHFLGPAEVAAIVESDEFKTDKLHLKKAGIGKRADLQINEAIRGDHILWIEPKDNQAYYHHYVNKLQQLLPYLNQNLYLSLKDIEIHLALYPVGTFYKRHLDQFKSEDHRKLSVICYLNENWNEGDGGQLRMYLPHAVDIFPLAGRLVCFRSDQIEHEVLPGLRERLSITGWMVDRKLD